MAIAAAHDDIPDIARRFLDGSTKRLLIGDKWLDAAEGATFTTKDPATGETLALVTRGGEEDVDLAVRAARRAFTSEWAVLLPRERSRLILRIAELIEEHLEELAVLETLDQGKPLTFARGDVAFAAEVFRYYAGAPTRLAGSVVPSGPDVHVYVRREPIGVCGQIIAWNFPLVLASWKVAPALATGNTVVLKPAEQTPLTAVRLGEICLEAGLPPGVFNLVQGDGETGAMLVRHPDVDKIAFTGSTEVGKLIGQECARTMKRVTLELGGKSPNIVFSDADMSRAVEAAMLGIFALSGQVCAAGSRLLVQSKIHDEFVDELVAHTQGLAMGGGLDDGTMLGPVVSAEQRDRVQGYIDLGVREGATVALAGGVHGERGYFVKPVIYTGVDNSMRIAQEEIFGPVLSVIPFVDADDAAKKANDTMYGLAAAVWTKDISNAHRLAARIKAGTVWVNTYNMYDAAVPFGGFKQSGLGRELGEDALDAYTEKKSVMVGL